MQQPKYYSQQQRHLGNNPIITEKQRDIYATIQLLLSTAKTPMQQSK